MNVKKILVINQPLNNRGDEAAHKSLIRMLNLELPNAEIKVLFVGGNQDSIKQFKVKDPQNVYQRLPFVNGYGRLIRLSLAYPTLAIALRLLPLTIEIKRIIKESDYVVCAPGGTCMGAFQNWLHLFLLKLTQSTGKPLAYYSRSFGPFSEETKSQRIFKKDAILALKKMNFLSLRDDVSQGFADKLGLRYIKSVDTAFLDTPRVEIPKEFSNQIKEPYMVFVPNVLIWHPVFKNVPQKVIDVFYLRIFDIINRLCPDMNIVMLPQLFNSGERNDVLYFKSLLGNKECVFIADDCYSSDIQQTIISKAQFVIGARYHSIVFAINNSVPFLALSYEHKISGLLKILDLEQYLLDLSFLAEDNLDEELMSSEKKITDILKNISFGKKNVRSKLLQARCIARNCSNEFISNFADKTK